MHIIKEENKDIDLVVVSKLMPVDAPAAVYNVTMMVVVVVVVVDKVVIQWDWKRAMMTLDCVAVVDYCSYKDLMGSTESVCRHWHSYYWAPHPLYICCRLSQLCRSDNLNN
uniref:Uncharacterized protein n=1 Tax=Glossina austeni TaxID=7395 RepID=A0A1A9V7L6_GLOAU